MEVNYADLYFKNNVSEILKNGTECETRAVWKNTGEKAHVLKAFGIVNTYDLSNGQFPALTLRPLAFKNCIDEILWIWQKKSNDVRDLHSHIWDSWAGEDHTIGMAYGYQVAHKYQKCIDSTGTTMRFDQTNYILNELRYNKYSRRMVANLYDICDLDNMNLHPCCYNFTLNVTTDKDGNDVLNMVLNQRSNDFIVANNWNVAQYAVLLCMFAQVSNMKPGKLVHVITDAHIYDRHIEIAKELLERESFEAPTLWIDKSITNFYNFTVDSFRLENYKTNDQVKNIPVAV